MEFRGMESHMSPVGEGTLYMANFSLYSEGEIRRRNGLTLKFVKTGRAIAPFTARNGQRFCIFVTNSGGIAAELL